MRDESSGYQAYLLRLWRVLQQGQWRWRASVDCPHTGEQHTFGTMAALFSFLAEKTDEGSHQGADWTNRQPDGGSVPCEEEESDDV